MTNDSALPVLNSCDGCFTMTWPGCLNAPTLTALDFQFKDCETDPLTIPTILTMPPICARCHLIVIAPEFCQCKLCYYCGSVCMGPLPSCWWTAVKNQICAAVDWPDHADFCVQASKMLHWKEPLWSLWCAFNTFIADKVKMVCHTYHICWSSSNTLPFMLEPLCSAAFWANLWSPRYQQPPFPQTSRKWWDLTCLLLMLWKQAQRRWDMAYCWSRWLVGRLSFIASLTLGPNKSQTLCG